MQIMQLVESMSLVCMPSAYNERSHMRQYCL